MWNCQNQFLGAWAVRLYDQSPDFRVVAVPPPWSWAAGPAERHDFSSDRQPLHSPQCIPANVLRVLRQPYGPGILCVTFGEKGWG